MMQPRDSCKFGLWSPEAHTIILGFLNTFSMEFAVLFPKARISTTTYEIGTGGKGEQFFKYAIVFRV